MLKFIMSQHTCNIAFINKHIHQFRILNIKLIKKSRECKGVIRSDTGAGTNRTTDFNNLPLWIRII